MNIKMGLIALVLVALTTMEGCALLEQKRDQPLAVKLKYIVYIIPPEMFQKPMPLYKLDPEVATDKDLAKWIIDSEERTRNVEKRLDSIQLYQAERLKQLEGREDVEIKK